MKTFAKHLRQEELTARLMGHSNPKLAGGFKMKAFHESPYGDDVVSELMNHQAGFGLMSRKLGCKIALWKQSIVSFQSTPRKPIDGCAFHARSVMVRVFNSMRRPAAVKTTTFVCM